jgi:hypothetical protein
MTFELPKVASAAAIDLDITENGLELTVRSAVAVPPVQKCDTFFMCLVFSTSNTAFLFPFVTAKQPPSLTRTSRH